MEIKIPAFGSLFPTTKMTSKQFSEVQLKYDAKKGMLVINRPYSVSLGIAVSRGYKQLINSKCDFEK